MKTLKWQSLINAKKLDKTQFLIFADPVSLVKNIELKSNPTNLSTTKLDEPIQSGLSMFTMSLFKKIENRHDVYKGKNHMKKFSVSLSLLKKARNGIKKF